MLSRIVQRSATHTRTATSQVLRKIGAPRPFSTVLPDLQTPPPASMNAKDGQVEFRAWCKANPEERKKRGIPTDPHVKFANDGWTNWFDFLGNADTSVRAEDMMSYEETQSVVQGMEFKGHAEFRAWCKANPEERKERGIPSDPDVRFANKGWKNWMDFLGKKEKPK